MSDALQLEPRQIVLGNNHAVPLVATKLSQVAGDRFREVPESGLSLTAIIALMNGPAATPIHASLSISVPEIGSTGTYFAEFAGANINAQLAAYADTTTDLYLLVFSGTSLRQYARCRVVSAALLGGL